MSSRRSATILLAVLSLAIAGGCRDAGSGSTADRRSDTQTDDGGDTLGDLPDLGRPECDPLSRARCALPWPSHRFLTPDEDRKTGYVLDFGDETLPANLSGDHVAPSTYRRFDGYGVGTPIMVAIRYLDPEQLPGEREIADSMA
ncbi:MAG: hypothetical protein ABEL76_00330, partial [Bradymonadaceae bacterium]